MEFNEKLQELRKRKGLTQEELARSLYVSRTAISKWESGRGYPNIESLRAIASFFSVTVDELLSPCEVLELAEKDQKQKQSQFRDLAYGLLDICMSMLFFLPFFAVRADGIIQNASLLALGGTETYLKYPYFLLVTVLIAIGILTLALQSCTSVIWLKSKTYLSLAVSAVSVLLFTVSLQPYAAIFTFVLLAIKGFLLIKRA